MEGTHHSTRTQEELERDDYTSRHNKSDLAVYGKSHVADGLRSDQQSRRRQEIGVRHREFTPHETARAEECRKTTAEQTMWWNLQAALLLERQKVAKLEQELRNVGNASYEDCGRDIDAKYIKCVISVLKWVVTIFLA